MNLAEQSQEQLLATEDRARAALISAQTPAQRSRAWHALKAVRAERVRRCMQPKAEAVAGHVEA